MKRNEFRDEFNLNKNDIAIGIIGRLTPIKNHSFFLRAIKILLEDSSRKFKVFIVGDGEDRLALESLCTQLDLRFNAEGALGPHYLFYIVEKKILIEFMLELI